jgi:hypothetical protein
MSCVSIHQHAFGVVLLLEILFLLGQALARAFSLSMKPFYKILLQTKELMAVALIVAIVSDRTNV